MQTLRRNAWTGRPFRARAGFMECARRGASSWWSGEGSSWVLLPDDSRENLPAASVVIWEPGEWIEYGTGSDGGKTESYWAEDLTEKEWRAVCAEAFGPDALD